MRPGIRKMSPQAFFRLEALIALFTMMYSAGSSWWRCPDIRVSRGKMNIKTACVGEFPVAIAAAELGRIALRCRIRRMPSEGRLRVKDY